MKKFIFILLIVLFSISMILMGISCRRQVEPTEEVTIEEEPAEEEKVTEEEKEFEGTTINVLYMSGPYADVARAVAPAFKEATGIEVVVADSPYEGYHEKMFTEFMSGSGNYDALGISHEWLGETAPYLVPLDSYIEAENYDTSDYIDGSYLIYTYLGEQLGFPTVNDVYSIVYRTDIFEENGIEPNPNWNWDEYHGVAEQLTKDDMFGTCIAGVKHQGNVYFINRYWSLGGKEATEDWEVTLENDTAVEALELITKSLQYSPPASKGADISEQNNMFATGQTAMAELWTTLIIGMLDDPNQSDVAGKWAVLPEPGGGPIYAATWCTSIVQDSKNKDAAWEWVKFYCSKESQEIALNEYGVMCARKSVFLDPANLEKIPWLDDYMLGLNRGRPTWMIPATMECWEGVMNDEVSKYNSGQQTAEVTVKNMQDQWEEVLSKNPPPEGVKNIWSPE